MEFYLDTADTDYVKKLYRTLPIQGVTTNPSIIAKSGRPVFDVLFELQDIFAGNGTLFAQVLGRSANEMIDNALTLQEKISNIVVKIPVIDEGIAAIKHLTGLNITTLGTAVYGAGQGFLAALAGAKYIAPYVNRIDSQGGNGITVVDELNRLLAFHCPTSLTLAASFKTPRQILDCLLSGCRAITVPPELAETFLADPAVFAALDQFEQDWEKAFQRTVF